MITRVQLLHYLETLQHIRMTLIILRSVKPSLIKQRKLLPAQYKNAERTVILVSVCMAYVKTHTVIFLYAATSRKMKLTFLHS